MSDLERFEKIKKLVKKSNKYCLYIELEDIEFLIQLIEKQKDTGNHIPQIDYIEFEGMS